MFFGVLKLNLFILTFLVTTLINRNKCFGIRYYEQNVIFKVIKWFYMSLLLYH